MTYAVGGLIQATDINGFVSTGTPNFNNIWSTGATNSGYGQTAVATVTAGTVVAQNPWNSLVTNMAKAAAHQGTTITAITAPVTGNQITFLSALSTNLGLINTNKLNAAAQGSTATSVSTTTDAWNDKLTVTFTVTFASQNAARYFFNAGGQLGISASHPTGTGINPLINDLCSDAGTVWLSSPTSGTATLASTAYNGVTKVGGANPAGATINTNYGFYSYTSTSTEVFKQFSDTVFKTYNTGTFMSISAASNGAGLITITVVYDEVPNGATVSAGTVTTLTVRSPSTAQLTNTWGTPALANSYVADSIGVLADYLIVAGGGAGGSGNSTEHGGGGGGAGGYLAFISQTINPGSYPVVVGAGGAGVVDARGSSGASSTFNSQTAIGGGGGGVPNTTAFNGGSGGGGSSFNFNTGGTGTSGQGRNGGNGQYYGAGGGGGAGAVGGNATQTGILGNGGNGGDGSTWLNSVAYAGGGGGGSGTETGDVFGGTGGSGGGGTGAGVIFATATVGTPTAGTANRGGGGGGGAALNFSRTTGASGGSGTVIIRYPGTVAKASGGTITITGGYVYHTFNSSGTFIVS